MGEMGRVREKEKKEKKTEFQGEIWEEWTLKYGRNGSSERKTKKRKKQNFKVRYGKNGL